MLLLVAAMISANANQLGKYSGQLYIGDLPGSDAEAPVDADILLYPGSDANHVNFVLPNFNFMGITLGDVIVINTPYNSTTGQLAISDYNLYMAALEETVTVGILDGDGYESKYNSATEALSIYLSIYVPSLSIDLPVLFQGAKSTGNSYQVRNAGFEDWETEEVNKSGTKYTGSEPTNWNSFIACDYAITGTLGSLGKGSAVVSTKLVQGTAHTGSYSALIKSSVVFGVKANGNLTTGRIHAGSTTANDASNYNYTDADNDRFNCPLTGTPDAISLWIKNSPVAGSNPTLGSVKAIIHSFGDYKDPAPSTNESDMEVAVAENGEIPALADFTQFTIPFNYPNDDNTDANSNPAAFILINITTNAKPGGGNATSSDVDQMWVDDIELVYNSELTGAKYAGEDIVFDENGAASVNSFYSAEFLTDLESNGRGAIIVPAYDEETAILTITVYGDDYFANSTNYHSYTVQFNYPDYSRDIENNKYGTLCLPFNAEVEGATLYTISDVTDNGVILSAVEGNNTEAGKAYIFKATSEELVASFSARAALGTNQGIVGNIKATDKTLTAEDNAYIIGSDNALHLIAGTATATIKQYRAYIDLSQFSANVAGRVRMITEEEMIATDIEEVETCKAVKFVENGNLYIKKNGRVYNALGQIVR